MANDHNQAVAVAAAFTRPPAPDIPAEWLKWHDTAKKLVAAIHSYLLATHPASPASSADKSPDGLRVAITEYRHAASRVGDMQCQDAISRQLYRGAEDALTIAEQLAAKPDRNLRSEHGDRQPSPSPRLGRIPPGD